MGRATAVAMATVKRSRGAFMAGAGRDTGAAGKRTLLEVAQTNLSAANACDSYELFIFSVLGCGLFMGRVTRGACHRGSWRRVTTSLRQSPILADI